MSKKRRMATGPDGSTEPIPPVIHKEYCSVTGCSEWVSKTRARSDGWFEFKVESRKGSSRFMLCPKHIPLPKHVRIQFWPASEFATAIAVGFAINQNPENIGKETVAAIKQTQEEQE